MFWVKVCLYVDFQQQTEATFRFKKYPNRFVDSEISENVRGIIVRINSQAHKYIKCFGSRYCLYVYFQQ